MASKDKEEVPTSGQTSTQSDSRKEKPKTSLQIEGKSMHPHPSSTAFLEDWLQLPKASPWHSGTQVEKEESSFHRCRAQAKAVGWTQRQVHSVLLAALCPRLQQMQALSSASQHLPLGILLSGQEAGRQALRAGIQMRNRSARQAAGGQ